MDLIADLFNTLIETLQFDIDDLLDGIEVELVEGDDLIQTVQELRRELLRQRLLHDTTCMFLILLVQHQACTASSTETYTATEVLQLACTSI